MLKRLLAEKRARLKPAAAPTYEALLQVPPSVSASLVAYAQDPAPLLARRAQLARAIETLQRR